MQNVFRGICQRMSHSWVIRPLANLTKFWVVLHKLSSSASPTRKNLAVSGRKSSRPFNILI